MDWDETMKDSTSTKIISHDSPFQFVEAYKSLRTNLQFASINNQYQKIIVTSSIPGEGKSTVSINLALSLANLEKKVLLIDCDLRKPVIHKYLHLSNFNNGGLTNLLSSDTVGQFVYLTSYSGLNVITSGPVPPNPAEILGSKRMEKFINKVESVYDYIIFDTPPVNVVTDAAVLSKICDGVIFVLRHKFTTVDTAKRAKSNLENVGANIIGCVLNKFNAKRSSQSFENYNYKKYSYGISK